ncbi:MAG: hypothetical protein H0U06_06890 [Solirubrobacterales bacterium]|nr:hypothetical protein [Solirubrobacterales bacterium]
MKETPKLRSEFWKGARRGTGMAFGVGGVVTVVTLLRDGPRATIKAMMKAGIQVREAAAELAEQAQDLYAEAQSERSTEAIPEG